MAVGQAPGCGCRLVSETTQPHRLWPQRPDIVSANILHPRLREAQVEASFDNGRHGDAVHDAFRVVEHLVRGLAHGIESSAVELMGVAFAPATGPLTDRAADARAQLAMQRLFVESFVKYRPSAKHAAVAEDELEALEGVLLADRLTCALARVAQRLRRPLPDVS